MFVSKMRFSRHPNFNIGPGLSPGHRVDIFEAGWWLVRSYYVRALDIVANRSGGWDGIRDPRALLFGTGVGEWTPQLASVALSNIFFND